MRVHEIVARHLPSPGVIADASGAVGGAWRPTEGVVFEPVSLPEGADGCTALVLAAGVEHPGRPHVVSLESLARALAAMAPGGTAVVLLTWSPAELPVGPLLEVFARSGTQVREALPVAHTVVRSAVVVTRSEALLPVWSYLRGDELPGPDDAQLRRVLGERALEGLTSRAREVVLSEQVAALRAELAQARAEAGRNAAALRTVEQSESLAVGRALAAVRRQPVAGLVALPGRLRRAGRTES